MSNSTTLFDAIVATPEAAKTLLLKSDLPKEDKQDLIEHMINFGTGAWAYNYYIDNFHPDSYFYQKMQKQALENFDSILVNSSKHSATIMWLFLICTEQGRAKVTKPAHLCRLICRVLSLTEKQLSITKAKTIIADVLSTLCPLQEFLKEPEFANILGHKNATKDILPMSLYYVKEGMAFAKRLEVNSQTTPVDAAKTLIDFPDIVAECINSITENAPCQEMHEATIQK